MTTTLPALPVQHQPAWADMLLELAAVIDEHGLTPSSIDIGCTGHITAHLRDVADLDDWAAVLAGTISRKETRAAAVHTTTTGRIGRLHITAVYVDLTPTYHAAYREAGHAVEDAAQRILAETTGSTR